MHRVMSPPRGWEIGGISTNKNKKMLFYLVFRVRGQVPEPSIYK